MDNVELEVEEEEGSSCRGDKDTENISKKHFWGQAGLRENVSG